MHETRSNWSRIHLPADLVDMFRQISKKHGYEDADPQFLYKLLKEVYPKDVAALTEFYGDGVTWLDTPPEANPPNPRLPRPPPR